MAFDEQSIRRIARSVLFTERLDRSRQIRGKRNWQSVPGEGNLIAKTRTGGVPGRDDTDPDAPVPGSATVDLWRLDTDLTPHALQNPTQEVTAYNLASEAVAGDTWIMLMRAGGVLWVVWEECPTGS